MWQIAEITAKRNLIRNSQKNSNEAWFYLGTIKFVVTLSLQIPPVIFRQKREKKLIFTVEQTLPSLRCPG